MITLEIYDYEDDYGYTNCIGCGDNASSVIVPKIEAAKGSPLTIKIATIGGSVFSALAIYNAMIEHGDVTTINTGYALSAGALIAMGGQTRKTYKASMFMMHKAGIDPWMMGRMTADDMQREMNMLETADAIMIDIFAKYTGLNKTKLNNMLAEETWLSGQDAYDMGLFTELMDGDTQAMPAASFEHITSKMPYKMVALATKNLKVENKDMSKEIITAVNNSAAQTNGLVAELKALFKELFGKKDDKPVNASFTLADGNAGYYNDGDPFAQGTKVFEDADMSKPMVDCDTELADGTKITVKDGALESVTEPEIEPDNTADEKDARIAELEAALAERETALSGANASLNEANQVLEKLKTVKSSYVPPKAKQEFNRPADSDKKSSTEDAIADARASKNENKK